MVDIGTNRRRSDRSHPNTEERNGNNLKCKNLQMGLYRLCSHPRSSEKAFREEI